MSYVTLAGHIAKDFDVRQGQNGKYGILSFVWNKEYWEWSRKENVTDRDKTNFHSFILNEKMTERMEKLGIGVGDAVAITAIVTTKIDPNTNFAVLDLRFQNLERLQIGKNNKAMANRQGNQQGGYQQPNNNRYQQPNNNGGNAGNAGNGGYGGYGGYGGGNNQEYQGNQDRGYGGNTQAPNNNQSNDYNQRNNQGNWGNQNGPAQPDLDVIDADQFDPSSFDFTFGDQ